MTQYKTIADLPPASTVNPQDLFELSQFGTSRAVALATVLAAVPPGGVPEAPLDGRQYARQSAAWAAVAPSGGTVTSVSVVTANGLAGSVATPSTTPALTLSCGVTGLLKGNGTAISAAVAGTDYVVPAGLPTSLPPSGAAGGDLSGSYPNPTLRPSATNGFVMTTVAGVAAWAATVAPPPATSVGLTPPGSPTIGQLWFYNDGSAGGGNLYIWYDDGNSQQWVPASPVSGSSSSGAALSIPQNSQAGSYTLVAADAGQHIYHPVAAAAATWTIPDNGSVPFVIGTTLSFVNDSTNAVTIAITSDTLVLSPGTASGSRTLAQGGVATALKVTSTRWIINGTGLS